MVFDTTSALASMFLWLIFSYLSVMVNCDVQRALIMNPLVVHACGLVAFIFLFTLLDTGGNGGGSVNALLIQSLGVYILFVLMTKSKWYFVSLVLALLLADQLLKKHVAFKRANTTASDADTDWLIQFQTRITTFVLWSVVAIIVIGTVQYAYLQKIEYGAHFSWYKLFVEVNRRCADVSPKYNVRG
jgi:hypothetical protein